MSCCPALGIIFASSKWFLLICLKNMVCVKIYWVGLNIIYDQSYLKRRLVASLQTACIKLKKHTPSWQQYWRSSDEDQLVIFNIILKLHLNCLDGRVNSYCSLSWKSDARRDLELMEMSLVSIFIIITDLTMSTIFWRHSCENAMIQKIA